MATTATEKKEKMVTLRSSDGKEFVVELGVAQQFEAIRSVFHDETLTPVPLPNVDGRTLAMVVEYCTKHAEAGGEKQRDNAAAATALQAWDAEFVNVDQSKLYDLITAADYLGINELLFLVAQAVADLIAGKSPEEIRALLHIKNDLEDEEEDELHFL